jgi:hypothetical protein
MEDIPLITGWRQAEARKSGLALKLQITKYKLQTNYKPQITKKIAAILWYLKCSVTSVSAAKIVFLVSANVEVEKVQVLLNLNLNLNLPFFLNSVSSVAKTIFFPKENRDG